MGCTISKLDNLPPVALCRDRCHFLDRSLLSNHALVDSHLAFSHSFVSLGSSLHRLFDQDGGGGVLLFSKIEDSKSSHSSSNSDSNLESPSDSDDEVGEKMSSGNLMFSNYDSVRGQSPPPPPTSSSWDFFNFFETYDRYEPVFASNPEREREKKHRTGKNRENKNNDVKKIDQSEKKKDSTVSDVIISVKASFEKLSELLSNAQRIGFMKDTKTSSHGLSSTLKKLIVWEQKLYLEVKAEERLRIILEKKCRQLKHLVGKKTDARKVDSVRTLIGNLSIQLKVSIQVVDRISITISKLRDGEFLEEITELIHGFLSMWKDMLDCYKHQSQVVTEAKCFDTTIFDEKLDDVHLEAAMELKIQLHNWRENFSNLISTQKDCIKAVNGWLMRCLLHEPELEGTPKTDIRPPTSPAGIGAPPVFVLCNKWSETMDKFSDKQVSESINRLISIVDKLLEHQSLDLQRMAMTNKDMEKKIRISMEIGDQQKMKMKKMNQAWEEKKKTVAVTAEALHKTSTFSGSDLQSSMKQVFSKLVIFSGDSIKAYEELCAIMEENSQMREKQTGP